MTHSLQILPEKYEFRVTTIVYRDKVAILWYKNHIGFVLESKEGVKSFLNYFDALWKIAKK